MGWLFGGSGADKEEKEGEEAGKDGARIKGVKSMEDINRFQEPRYDAVKGVGETSSPDWPYFRSVERKSQSSRQVGSAASRGNIGKPPSLAALNNERRMSWSDESGQDLVSYFEEGRSHSSLSSQGSCVSASLPIKSAMKRSTNTISTTGSTVSFFDGSSGSKDDDDNDVDCVKGDGRDEGEGEGEGEGDRDGGETSPTSVCETISQSQREARGVPEENGEIGGHLSPDIVLPGTSPESQYEATDVLCSLPKPGDFSPANQYFGCKANTMIASSGVISPQWGWYISTTPPLQQYNIGYGKNNNQITGVQQIKDEETKDGGLALALNDTTSHKFTNG